VYYRMVDELRMESMVYSCGHGLDGKPVSVEDHGDPRRLMPTSSGLCPLCLKGVVYEAPELKVPDAILDLIPEEGKQCGPLYFGITPQEIGRMKKIAVEAYRRGKASK